MEPSETMKKAAKKSTSVQSLDRGLAIVEAVAKSAEPVTLGHLTDLIGIDKSSVFRLANTLKQRGFLANPDGRKDYILGPTIWFLSRKCNWHVVLTNLCQSYLKKLAKLTGETTHLSVREGNQALFIDHQTATSQMIVVSDQTGEFAPLYCTAQGKALLADLELADLKALFGQKPLRVYTQRTINSIERLAAACAKVRVNGYAVDDSEYVGELRCLAAPIRDKDNKVVAAIGISAPVARLPQKRFSVAVRQVCRVAQEISALLGSQS